jgi:hypothetical protein
MTELSKLGKQILGGANAIDLYTQQEFDEALVLAKAEIMQVAIETTKQAIMIEREECAKIAEGGAGQDNQEVRRQIAEAIRARIPSQRKH